MHNEQVFTPKHIVNFMLDRIGYNNIDNIFDKKIIDNSCGNGNFLVECVKRYIDVCLLNNIKKETIRTRLGHDITGIEIDSELCQDTIERLNGILKEYGIEKIKWNIYNCDSYEFSILNKGRKFDYVVGNPPYCKVHDINDDKREIYKKYINYSGTFDLYVLFFYIGINMLNDNGKLIYITPISWLNSVCAREFRKFLITSGKLSEIIDLKGLKVFSDATTFTAITLIDNNKTSKMINIYDFDKFDEPKLINYCDINKIVCGKYNEFSLLSDKDLQNQKNIIEFNGNVKFRVKNGFATLNDKLFLVNEEISDRNIIKCVKASKGITKNIIFPYDRLGNPYKYEELSCTLRKILENKANLLGINTKKKNWFEYGRSQAIKDVNLKKISVNNLFKSKNDIKLVFCDENVGVYSGYYILSDDNFMNEETISFIKEILVSDDFIDFVKSMKSYKNGGYFYTKPKYIEKYLNYNFYIKKH